MGYLTIVFMGRLPRNETCYFCWVSQHSNEIVLELT
jgi:hypothetical protein